MGRRFGAGLAAVAVFSLAVALTRAQSTATLEVADGGSPVAGADVFTYINAGKVRQKMGTTDSTGSLPFDPTLLYQKKGTAYVKECPDGRKEVVLVPYGANLLEEDRDCRERKDAQKSENGCKCRRLGLWIFQDGQVSLNSGGSHTARNVGLGAGVAGGIIGGIVAATNGGSSSGSSSVPSFSTSSSTGTTTTTSIPPPPSTSTLSGTYNGNFTRTTNACDNFFPAGYSGRLKLDVSENGTFTARITGIEEERTYQGTAQATGDSVGTGQGTGMGTFRGAYPFMCTITIQVNGNRLTSMEMITVKRSQVSNMSDCTEKINATLTKS